MHRQTATTASLVALAFSLSACASSSDDFTNSRFATPLPDGTFLNTLGSEVDGTVRNLSGEGVAYRVGDTGGDGFIAEAGIIPGTAVLDPPADGVVQFSGQYEMAFIQDIELNGNFLSGDRFVQTGGVTLTADFDAGTLTGGNALLTVDGRMSGSDLSGGVSFRGVRGSLDGLVGSDEAIGAFHGNSADLIYSGGFVTQAD